MFYDAKFGRKRMPETENGQKPDKPLSNGSSSSVTSNGNVHVKNTSEMAIYEQFQAQVAHLMHSMMNIECEIVFIIRDPIDLITCFQARSSTITNGVLSAQTDERPYEFLLCYSV